MKQFRFLLALAVPVIAFNLNAVSASATSFDGKQTPPTDKQHSKDDKHAKDDKHKDAKPTEAKGAAIDKPAPEFALKDLDGKSVKLSDYKGKIVVLEWFNPECPVSKGHHTTGALKDQAERVSKDGVVWLSINSSAAGKEGSGLEKNKKAVEELKIKNPILLDESGATGHLYGAMTTPNMFVIDAKGVLVYKGAIDNQEKDDKLVNFVDAALADLKAGKPVAKKETKPYGCNVKYANPN